MMKSKRRGKHLSRSGGGYSRRLIHLVLCLSMLMSLFNGAAVLTTRAAESVDTGLCDHHTQHNAYCGYVEAVEGSPCAHVHTEECYSDDALADGDTVYTLRADSALPENCTHAHDGSCGYVEAVAGHPCEYRCLDCEYAEVLRKMEEDYRQYGVLPPEIVNKEAYLNGIAPLAFSTDGYIDWEDYFAVSGQPVSEETWLKDARKISEEGYRVDGRGVLPSKFPSYPDDNVHFANLSINSVEVVRIGILESNTGGADTYYYMTLTHQTGTSGTPEVSATLLKDGEKFQVNYVADEYNITYEVRMILDGTHAEGETYTENGIAYTVKKATNETTNEDYYYVDLTDTYCPYDTTASQYGIDPNWTHFTFHGTDTSSTTNGAVSFDVGVPYGYTGQVLCYFPDDPSRVIDLTGDRSDLRESLEKAGNLTNEQIAEQVAAKVVNDGFPLGTEPVYKYYSEGGNEGVRSTSGGPSAMKVNATFYSDSVTEDRQIVVILEKIYDSKNSPVFDVRYWIQTQNANGRGSVGYIGTGERDIDTWDDWSWNNDNNPNAPLKDVNPVTIDPNKNAPDNKNDKCYRGNVYYMRENGKGTYDFTWTFQGNDSANGYTLDSLELNGVSLSIPFSARDRSLDPKIAVNPDKCTTVTILPDGAVAELTLVRAWLAGSNNANKRAYTLTITGAATNVTVTGGNLMQGTGAPEFIPSTLTGVTANRTDGSATFQLYADNDWTTKSMSLPVVLGDNNTNMTSDEHGFNIRFQLIKGYESPTFSWILPDGTVLEGSQRLGKDDPKVVSLDTLGSNEQAEPNVIYRDGTGQNARYYIRLETLPSKAQKIILLNITASLKKYMVRYIVNDEKDPDDYFNAPADKEVINMPSYSTDPSKWEKGLYDAIYKQEHIDRYDDRGGQFYDAISGATVAISDKVPEHDTEDQDDKRTFLFWAVVDADEKVVYQTVTGEVADDEASPTGLVAIVTEKSEDGTTTTTRTVPVLKETGTDGEEVLYPIDTESFVPVMGKGEWRDDGEGGYLDEDDNPVTSTGYLLSSIKKLAYKVYPNGTIDLRSYQNYAAAGDKSIGGADSNYYARRLKAVWGDTPASFRYYIRLVYEDAQTGETNLLSFVQDVTTEWDAKVNEDGTRPVGVNTSDDIFVDWLKQNPLYAFDEARNTKKTAGDWAEYPEGDLLIGSDALDENAHYRINGDYSYSVTNGGVIIIYMKLQNGTIPIAKKIYGSPRGEDPFTYTIKMTLRPEDIDANNEDLFYMLPVGIYYGWPDAGMDTSVGVVDNYEQPSAPVEVKFTRHTGGNHHGALEAACPVCEKDNVTQDAPTTWYSEATFTLEGGQAIELNVPQGEYTITETSVYSYDVYVNGNDENNVKSMVLMGETSDRVVFENHTQAIQVKSVPVVKKTIVGSDGNTVTDQDGTFSFTLTPVADYGTKVELLKEGANGELEPVPLVSTSLKITTSNGTGTNSFEGFTFNFAGTYEFLITETAVPEAKEEGALYLPQPDSHLWRVVVVNQNGQLALDEVSVDGTDIRLGEDGAKHPVEFTNLYLAPPQPGQARVIPTVYKDLVGRSLWAGEFNFEIIKFTKDGTELQLPANKEVTNSANGTVTFQPITFTEAGTYEVTIQEKIPDGALNFESGGFVYDNRTITITYTVEKEGNDLAVTDAVWSGGDGDYKDTFTNKAYWDGSFTVKKDYDTSKRPGKAWNDNETFTVLATLVSADGVVAFNARGVDADLYETMAEGDARTRRLNVNNKDNGDTFNFRFYGEGKYVFSVYELYGGLPGVSYDKKAYTVTFTVTASSTTAEVKPAITQEGKVVSGNTITFSNVFWNDRVEIPLRATKALEGGTMTNKQFRFVMEDSNGTVVSTGYNDASGNIVFSQIFRSAGTYIYWMKENVGTDERIDYDDTVYTVKIDVDVEDGAPKAEVTYYKGEEAVDANKLDNGKIPAFTNKMKEPNTLIVTNTVVDAAKDPTKEFTFTFTFRNKNNQLVTGQAFSYIVSEISPEEDDVMPLFATDSAALTGMIASGQSIQLRDGQKVTIQLSAGVVYSYAVVESDYSPYTVRNDHGSGATASGVLSGGETIVNFTNTKATPTPSNPSTTSVTVHKVWEDNNSENRPGSVTVRLYRNGTPYGDPVTLDEANNWSHTWTDLSDSYTWTVDELEVPEGYESSVTHTGRVWTITNKLPSDPTDPPVDPPDPPVNPPLDDVPQTGDNSHLGLWMTLVILSAIGMLGTGVVSNKKRYLFSFNGRHLKK